MREKALVAFMGFLLTGVLGTMITSWIQQRGWRGRTGRQDRQRHTERARRLSERIRPHQHALARDLSHGARDRARRVADEWKAANDEFAASDKDWAIRYTSVARDVAFYVDTPFAIEARTK